MTSETTRSHTARSRTDTRASAAGRLIGALEHALVIGAGAILSLGLALPAAADPEMPTTSEAAATQDASRVPRAAAGAEGPAAEAAEPLEIIAYIPPSRGRAQNTAGAGTRTLSKGDVTVRVLAPRDHVAFTTRAQPTLYWYVSQDTDIRVDLTLVDPDEIDPLLELTVPGPVRGGIHALRLDELGLELSPDKVYRWHVALVQDARRRANDTSAEGLIARTPVTRDLERNLGESRYRYAPYALSGIWYDAMDELLLAIEKDPRNKRLRLQRSALLEQANLEEVAIYAVRAGR